MLHSAEHAPGERRNPSVARSVDFYARAQKTSATLSEDHARSLAVSTLTAAARRLPGIRFQEEKRPHPEGFYWFEITANTPNDVSPLLGYFAVNKTTGDVWNPVQCKRLTSSAIRRFQEQLRRKAKISDAEFRQIAATAPCWP